MKGDMIAEMELGEMMRLWVEEQRDIEVELQALRNKVVSLEDQKMERENVLKEGAEGGRVVNGEKLDVGKEFKGGDVRRKLANTTARCQECQEG
jgi:hypothetical protein